MPRVHGHHSWDDRSGAFRRAPGQDRAEVRDRKNTATEHFREKQMGAFKRKHPLPPASPRRCVMRSQCDRCCLRFMLVLMDRAARSSFHQKKKKGARRGPRARQCASAAPHATRQQSCGCAYSDVRWGSTGTITMITTYISHGGRRNVYASGWLCVFLAPSEDARGHHRRRDGAP